MRSRAPAAGAGGGGRCSRPSSVSPPLPIIDSSDIDSDIASCIDLHDSIELCIVTPESPPPGGDAHGFWPAPHCGSGGGGGVDGAVAEFHPRAAAAARPTDLPIIAASSIDQHDETSFLRHVQVCPTPLSFYKLLFLFFDPGTQFPWKKKITLCNTKKYKNQAGINITFPPPSQNSYVVRWHCTAYQNGESLK